MAKVLRRLEINEKQKKKTQEKEEKSKIEIFEKKKLPIITGTSEGHDYDVTKQQTLTRSLQHDQTDRR